MSAGMHSYFYEDEVFRVNSRGQVTFGLVLDNCDGSSSSASGSEAEQPLQRGDLRIVWHPSGLERIVTDRAVGLADRALMPGDVVRRMIKGKDTQRGYCRDISVTGAVQVVGTNLVLPAVPSERLHPLEEYTIDLAVCLDSWVGTSKTVNTKLTLVSGDGSKFEVPDAGMCLLEDCMQRRRRGARGARGYENANVNEYYPGQTVVGPMGVLEGVTWLNITKEMETARRHKMREHKFTVESVETESVGVHWQCRALGEQADGGPPKQPPYLVEGEDLKRLKLLNLFEPCTLQVGAKNFLILTEEDTFCSKAQWRKNQNKLYRSLRRQTRSERTKTKDPENKESNAQQPQESNVTNSSHTFRIPGKPKKRSVFNREGKFTYFYNNLQLQPTIDSKANYLTNQKDSSVDSKEEPNAQSKMDVDIVIVDGNKETQIDTVKSIGDPKIECLDSSVSKDSEVVDKKIINTHQNDECSHLDVPDKACNGKCTSSDRSCSPDVDMSSRQKKLRKTKLSSSTNNSRSNSPAVYNGDHKYYDQPLHANVDDSDSWGNTSSDEATDSDSCGTWSSQCSSSSMASGRGKKSPHLVTKFLKGKRLKRTARRDKSAPPPKPGDKVVVETLCTKSKANVVWQDGTIELDIPSTDLYPIHHLDGQECFPGDFVISEVPLETSSHRDYGVVQKVDHYGRTAIVKWFRTYTSCQEPVPQYISESEVSVYDVKDHPDFQYRPGTVVIRVANFTGTEAKCTAGQVMDNFPTGRVHVWWVDGHKSMCWPQDLYKVGEYDSDEGDIWGDDGSSSDDSWETQSSAGESDKEVKTKKEEDKEEPPESELLLPTVEAEASIIKNSKDLPKVPRGLEPKAAAHIERGLNAMARMEEILSQNPSLQSHEIMRKLLTLYKDCRFLDRLMGTSFFHEDHFQGLIERVRERGGGTRDTISGSAGVRRVHNQVLRLFSRDDLENPESVLKDTIKKIEKIVPYADLLKDGKLKCPETSSADDCTTLPQVEIANFMSNELKCYNSNSNQSKSGESSSPKKADESTSSSGTDGNYNLKEPVPDARMLTPSSDDSLSKFNTPAGSMGDLTNPSQHGTDKNRNEDSGIDSQPVSASQSGNTGVAAVSTSGDCERSSIIRNMLLQDWEYKDAPEGQTKANTSNAATTSSSDAPLSNRNVCLKLCSLITIQLMKACAEVSRRRNSLFVPFLNRLMKEKETTGAPLPYRFSVQFDELVVTMTDDKDNETGETVIDKPPETSSETDVESSKEEDKSKDKEEEDSAPAVSDDSSVMKEYGEGYTIVDSVPTSHRFRLSLLQPSEPRAYHQAIAREIRLLKSLPHGVWVRGYEDRMDLLSIMIAGPAKTPYEDGLFLFDVQLGGEYPRAPPLCHYLSFCSDRLNPNLYEDGKVCVSLLGTWSGRGVEVWGRDSSLLQVIVSLQGLILCAEPYFNEAGFDKQKGSQQGSENSRMYNEMVLLKLVQSLTKLVLHPPEIFKKEILIYQNRHASGLYDRLTRWMLMSEEHNSGHPESPLTPDTLLTNASKYDFQPPEYPLIPASKGFCLTLRSSLDAYRNVLSKAGISFEKKL